MTAKKGNEYRDYDRRYQAQPEQVAKRVKRNAARRALMREGVVAKGDGMDVDHKRSLASGGGNQRSNLRAVSAASNRARNGR